MRTCSLHVHWVSSPEEEGEGTERGKESSGLLVLALDGLATVDSELVDDDEQCQAGHGVVTPFLATLSAEGGKETSQDHDEIGHNGHKHACTVETSNEGQVNQEEWSSDTPVNVTGPVDLAVDVVLGVWETMLVGLDLVVDVQADTTASSHGEV